MFLLLLQTLRLWRVHKGICVYFKKTVILISQLVAFFFLYLHSLLMSLSFLLFESQFLSLFSYYLSSSMLFFHLWSPFICFLSTSIISPLSAFLLFLSYLQSFLSFSLWLSLLPSHTPPSFLSLFLLQFLPLPLHLSTQPYQYSQVSYTV